MPRQYTAVATWLTGGGERLNAAAGRTAAGGWRTPSSRFAGAGLVTRLSRGEGHERLVDILPPLFEPKLVSNGLTFFFFFDLTSNLKIVGAECGPNTN
jgi:hypothetical protein